MLAQRLKQLRAYNHINQITLANQLEVTQSTVGKWETGDRVPDTKTLKKIADYFSVSIDYLLGYDKESNPETAPEIVLLARRLSEIPEQDRNRLINTFKDTLDIYYKAKDSK